MGKGKKLQCLPSQVEGLDGSFQPLCEMSPKEREEFEQQILKTISLCNLEVQMESSQQV